MPVDHGGAPALAFELHQRVEGVIVQVGGARCDELRVWHPGADEQRGAREIRQDGVQLVPAAARQQRDDGAARIESNAGEELFARRRRGRDVEQRMPDPLHRNAGILVDLFFERKNHQDPIDEPLHGLHASRAPRPELRADVVHDGDAELPERAAESEVEVGKVDRDEDVRARGGGVGDQAPVGRIRAREHPRDLEKAGDGQSAEIADERGARRPQAIAAESGDDGRRIDPQDLRRERAGVEIAGRLSARDHDAHVGFRASARLGERRRGQLHIELEGSQHPLHVRRALAASARLERHLQSLHVAIIGERLFDPDHSGRLPRRLVTHARDERRLGVEEQRDG